MKPHEEREQLDGFCAMILTHGRPDRVFTYDSLRRCGYTGPIYLIVDDLDPTKNEYLESYPNQVVIFNKKAIAEEFDQGDNFEDMRAIIYARNASFAIARRLGFRYFIQLDDDYRNFSHRFDAELDYFAPTKTLKRLDTVLAAMMRFYRNAPRIASLAMAQGGDFMGGDESQNAEIIKLQRKCMNSFICSVDREFQFIGRINEDVNTYTHAASKGALFLTTNQVSLGQMQTQTNPGGMTETYVDGGTYIKSFYSIMYQPSSVKICYLQSRHGRVHHAVRWRNTAPMILREELRK